MWWLVVAKHFIITYLIHSSFYAFNVWPNNGSLSLYKLVAFAGCFISVSLLFFFIICVCHGMACAEKQPPLYLLVSICIVFTLMCAHAHSRLSAVELNFNNNDTTGLLK